MQQHDNEFDPKKKKKKSLYYEMKLKCKRNEGRFYSYSLTLKRDMLKIMYLNERGIRE